MSARRAIVEVATRWFRSARSDLVIARRALADRDDLDPWVAAFHAQQAAEKVVKGALVVEQIPFTRTHEVERLLALLPPAWVGRDAQAAARLSRFAVSGRYPDDPSLSGAAPTWAEAEEAVRLADELARAIMDTARTRGVPT